MNGLFKEESVILVSVVKWLALATVVGVITGCSTTVFVMSLNFGVSLRSGFEHYFLLMPVGFVLSALIIKYVFPAAEGHGASKVIESVHKAGGKLRPLAVPVEFLRTFITLTTGGSAGKEGPSAQIGAGLASMLADALRFEDMDRKKLVICGISGGFASVFGTPLAGAIFGVEVLFAGSVLYEVLLPSIVAGVISYQVSSWLGLTYFYNPIEFVPTFSELFFIKVALSGVFFGLASFILIETLKLGRKASEMIRLPLVVKALIGGSFLAGLTLVFSNHYLGLGLNVIQGALEGNDVPWYAFLMKSLFTAVTLGFGGHGGIGTPIFFVGSTAGSAFSHVIGLDPAMLAAIGFVALLAGAANTPIAASIMSIELFGPEVAPYAAIACVISFVISGHRSAYPSQVLAIRKSSSLDVNVGGELGEISPRYMERERSVLGLVIRLFIRPQKD
jgi:H+/Cl- antiporter ClcA